MRFAVEVREELSHTYIVEANSFEEAGDIISEALGNDDIHLDYEDSCGREIHPCQEFEGGIVPDGADLFGYDVFEPETRR